MIATSESWTDKATNEKKENTEWHRVVIYQRLAEIAGEYLRKGSKVYIEGKLKTRKWTDKDGVERYTTEIIANELQMLDGRNNGNAGGMGGQPQGGGQQGGYQKPAQQQGGYQKPAAQGGQRQGQNRQQAAPQPQQPPMEPPIDFDDDIPF